MAFALASAWSVGEAMVVPKKFPFREAVEVAPNLAAVVRRTIREGCIGETLAVLEAALTLHFLTETSVVPWLTDLLGRTREYLEQILIDEQKHAELAWATV